jgi:hypothetical protein
VCFFNRLSFSLEKAFMMSFFSDMPAPATLAVVLRLLCNEEDEFERELVVCVWFVSLGAEELRLCANDSAAVLPRCEAAVGAA